MSESKPKKAASVSLRSAAQATDSTCNGWRAKSAATSALGQRAPVAAAEKQKNEAGLFATWMSALTSRCPPASEAEELAIEHVGEPGERMPVGGVEGGESPGEAGKVRPRATHRIVADVEVVIEADELVAGDLRVNGEGDEREREEDPEIDRRWRRRTVCGSAAPECASFRFFFATRRSLHGARKNAIKTIRASTHFLRLKQREPAVWRSLIASRNSAARS